MKVEDFNKKLKANVEVGLSIYPYSMPK